MLCPFTVNIAFVKCIPVVKQLESEVYIHVIIFCAFKDLFVSFFLQGGMIVKHSTLRILKNRNCVHKFEFIVDFLCSIQGLKYTYMLKY